MKYIIVQSGGCETPILFTELMDHCQVAGGLKVVSAGFVSIGTKRVDTGIGGYEELECTAYGKSVSLNLSSRPDEDTRLITRAIQN